MTIVLLAVIAFALIDVILCGIVLTIVGVHYHRLRRVAADGGEVLPAATGQFLFLGCMMAAGVVVLYGSIYWVMQGDWNP